MNELTPTVEAMIGFDPPGILIPNEWYRYIKYPSGKTQGIAISILGEIVRLFQEGQGCAVQCHPSYFENQFGFSKGQVRQAYSCLANMGAIKWQTDSKSSHVELNVKVIFDMHNGCYNPDEYSSIKNTKSGFVYLINAKEAARYKIGASSKPDERLRELSKQSPFELELMHQIGTEDSYGLEKQFHERFAEKRVNGEWFELAEDDVSWIKEQ